MRTQRPVATTEIYQAQFGEMCPSLRRQSYDGEIAVPPRKLGEMNTSQRRGRGDLNAREQFAVG